MLFEERSEAAAVAASSHLDWEVHMTDTWGVSGGPTSAASVGSADLRALEFLTDGMLEAGWYELRTQRDRGGEFVRGRAVLSALGSYSYFGVLPRTRIGGMTRESVVEQANLLWLDVDSPEALDHLSVFADLGIPPSLVIHSGHGYWWYWK